jgi:hypothetical protein
MTGGGLRLAGASGALPVWLATAQGLAAAGLLGDAAGVPPEVPDPRDTVRVAVESEGGLPAPGGDGTVLFRGEIDDGAPAPARVVRRLGAAPPPGAPGASTGAVAPSPAAPAAAAELADDDEVWVDEMEDPAIPAPPSGPEDVPAAPSGEAPEELPPDDLPVEIDPRIAPGDGADPG